jgi:hypothetical protein
MYTEATITLNVGMSSGMENYFWQNHQAPRFIFTRREAHRRPMSGIRIGVNYENTAGAAWPVGTHILVKGLRA